MGLFNKVFSRNQKKAYVCYDDADGAIARDACRALEADGISCWIKYRDSDGKDLVRDVIHAIEDSNLLVLIYSKDSMHSDSVAREVDTAFDSKIPMLVFRIDEAELSENLTYFLSNQAWVDAFPNPNLKFEVLSGTALKILNGEFVPLGIRYISLKKSAHNGGGPPVFISCSTGDENIAEDICGFLESNNVGCWMAPRDVKTAVNYSGELVEAIDNAELLLLISSKKSLESSYIENELDNAFNSDKPIIAFNTDGTSPEGEKQFLLRNAVWIDADAPNSFARLLDEVNAILDGLEDSEDIAFDDEIEPVLNSSEPIPHVDEVPFPAYDGDEPYAFVSYAHKDYKFVFNEIKRFQRQGLNIWYDEGIAPGNEWLAEIGTALSGASLFIVFISNNSVASKFVRKEITYAINNDIPFIAIHIEKTSMPIQLDLALGDLQAILRYGMSDGEYYRRYTKAFNSHLKEYGIRLKSVDEIE